MTLIFIAVVAIILVESARAWLKTLNGGAAALGAETEAAA